MILLWALLCGMAVTGGLVVLAAGVRGTEGAKPVSALARWKALRAGEATTEDLRMRRRARWAASVVLGAVVWLVTGVFMAAMVASLSIVGVPWLLSPTKTASVRIGQLEALGEWTQRLSDVLRLGMGLEQAIVSSRKGAPAGIEEQVANLTDRLQAGWRPQDALRAFGDELDDVTGDKVVAALLLSITDRGPGLAQALEDLAGSVREVVAKRRRIESDRAKPRTTMRWMTIITAGVYAGGLLVPNYTAPYGTFIGQLFLAAVTAGFIAVLALMRSFATHRNISRFLIADPRSRVRTSSLAPSQAEV
ncbi:MULTISPECIES: type II secretion system F family protein [unclassified Streptomyces]|uniref:type II secretion system F family protein n=1 Tax=unclassified Streptomyces TaxID=2593676 RepID=UPI002DD9720C|nr:type II secretion system F family protein [Streptomyces sp. NBC_01766]WSC24926.1 type II secretion system F family protein [Streptomyces sp. NBC_01766]